MILKELFGTLPEGNEVFAYTLINKKGAKAKIITFGGAVVQLYMPDQNGRLADVVAGYDSLYDYATGDGYLGALIGRYGNRIGSASFTLNGKTYQLYRNDHANTLHGGQTGFSHKLWDAEPHNTENNPSLVLRLTSEDGDENYPGKLDVVVTYTLTEDNELSILYQARTDAPTICNLTNHSYFNLGGYASGDIFGHVMKMDVATYLPTDKNLIPTGELRSVDGTPFDFRSPKTIGKDFNLDDTDMGLAGGYDHCLNFVGGAQEKPTLRVEVMEPESGRIMQVYTDQPCVQFYTGNFLCNPDHPLKGGLPQQKQHFFCLETQKMPDSPNHKNFTNTVLQPGEIYKHHTIYKFLVKD